MDVLLREDLPKLGRRGDVVKVASGYGRNYLIPQGLAFTVTEGNRRLLAQEHKKWVAKELVRKEQLQALADELAEFSVTIEANANEERHLFGSVTYEMIRRAFAEGGYELEVRQLSLEDPEQMPIKECGLYNVKVELHHEISVWTKCFVVPSGDEDEGEGGEESEDGGEAEGEESSEGEAADGDDSEAGDDSDA